MNKTEFIYESFSPAPHSKPQRNKVIVWVEGGKIHYERRYINQENQECGAICHTFEKTPTAEAIAKQIHWGCSGTSFNSLQLQGLIEKIKPVVESLK